VGGENVQQQSNFVDLNRLNENLESTLLLLGDLRKTLQANSTPANVHSSISSAVAIANTLTKTATALRVLMANSDQMFSRTEFAELFGRLGDAIGEAANNVRDRFELPDKVRDFFTDEVERLFSISVEQYQQEITERRRQGISALQIEDQR